MAGKHNAPTNGKDLETRVAEVATGLGLRVDHQVRLGRRLWGAERRIDVVLTHPVTRQRLGVECKYQGTLGTAEEKIPALIEDIDAWPIRGIVVVDGEGFSTNMRGYLVSTGRVIDFADTETWLRFFFGLDIAE